MEKLNIEQLEANLAVKTYEKQYTPVPNKNLKNSKLKEQLTRILHAVGEEFDNEASYLVVKAEDGAFSRLFLPTVYACGEEGNRYAALRFSDNQKISLSKLEEVGEVDFDERTLVFMLEEEGYEPLVAKFHLFVADGENPPEKMEIKQAWKQGNLVDLLGKEPKMVQRHKLQELEDGSEIQITGYKSFPTKYGDMYIISTPEGIEYIANTNVKKVLQANPEISPDKPATCKILSRRQSNNGKINVNTTLEVDEKAFGMASAIDLDF